MQHRWASILDNERKTGHRRALPIAVVLGAVFFVLASALPVLAADYPGEPLRLGSRGDSVRIWQGALGVEADGYFGEQTHAATVAWQIKNGLVGDGIVGPASWKVMFPGSSVNIDNAQIAINGSGNGHGVGLTQYGAKGMALEGYSDIQILEHFYQGSSVKNLSDAVPGSWVVTESLPIWVGMRQNRSELTFVVTAGVAMVCFDGDYDSFPLLAEGKVPQRPNTFTDLLLTRLMELGHLQKASGVFDQSVREAVASFQAAQGLGSDGAVGARTWEALLRGSNHPDCAGFYFLDTGDKLTVTASGDGSCSTNLVGAATECRLSIRGLSSSTRVGLQGLNYGSKMIEFAHGNIRVRPNGGKVHFSMQLDIEDYVAGIAEIPTGWPDAAHRAQAIAARSYAVYRMLRWGSESSFGSSRKSACWCHVLSDTRDQVYAGWNRQIQGDGRWEKVGARPTAGKVVTHPQEKLTVVQAFYSSSSGGATEDSSALWGTAGRPYLVSVQDPWSVDPAVNPGAFWSKSLSLTRLLEIYSLENSFDGVISVSTDLYPWGSAQHVKVVGIRGGNRVTERVPASTLKSALRLRSRYFKIDYVADWWASPPAPTGVTVTGGTAATVTWDPVPSRFAPRSYTVSVVPAHADPLVVTAPATRGVMTGLRTGVEYSFTVTATNQSGTGASSAATAPQVVIAERPYPGEPLRAGSRGEAVRAWQEALGVTADGEFGPGTAAATRRWQQSNGLDPDGIVGEQSWNKMFAGTPAPTPETPGPADPEVEPEEHPQAPAGGSDVPSYPGFVLRVGSQGKWVRTWQSALGIRADGYFGTQTAQATRAWQRSKGLTADGVVGMESWQTMFPGAGVEQPTPPPAKSDGASSAAGDESPAQHDDPASQGSGGGAANGSGSNVPSYPGTPLRLGSQGVDVIFWQRALGIAADGYFGPATLSSTKAWQHKQGLTATGTVDLDSWRTMFAGAGVRVTVSTPSSTPVSDASPDYPGQPLKRGSQGPDVVTWQRALGILADGHFGTQTEQATRNWQRIEGLTVNGIVDAESWAAMFPGSSSGASVARSSSTLLEQGDTGLLVQLWQEGLNRALDGEDIEVTKVFDAATANYTRFWQRTRGLAANGRVTAASWTRMFPGAVVPEAGDRSNDLSDISDLLPLKKDDTGVLVEMWQRALDAALTEVNLEMTGVFDADTVTYTRFWQRTQNLAANGKVSEASWYRMFPR